MSLRWDFKRDFIGKVKRTNTKGEICYNNLYTGNAMLIELAETKKHYYLNNFIADEHHLKNCCEDKSVFDDSYKEFIFINTKNLKNSLKIADKISKANPNIKFTFQKSVKKWYYAEKGENNE